MGMKSPTSSNLHLLIDEWDETFEKTISSSTIRKQEPNPLGLEHGQIKRPFDPILSFLEVNLDEQGVEA